MAGHLGEAHVRPTLEVILAESPAHLRKRHTPESGPALIRIDATIRLRSPARCGPRLQPFAVAAEPDPPSSRT